MRLTTGLLTALLTLGPAAATAGHSPVVEPAGDDEEDLLGELVVEAKRRGPLVLPKIAVVPPPDGAASPLHDLLVRDLQLSGEFEVVEVAPGLAFDDPFDAKAYVGAGLEAVVTAQSQTQGDRLALSVRVYLPDVGDLPAWSKTTSASPSERRVASHRLSDGIIGALTGTDGPFASRLILVRTEGSNRRAYVVDPDGKGLTAVSPADQLVVTATLDSDARAHWAASVDNGRYRLYRAGRPDPIAVNPSGSIYGIAFAPNGVDVALSIASGASIHLFEGAIGKDRLDARTKLDFALTPTYAPDGRVVYAGVSGKRRQIYVGGKAVSPKAVSASSPTVCKHPDGARLVYAVGVDKRTDLVASRLDGRDVSRLTWGAGRNFAPACSPDGRLVAFFSTRKQGEGPGLYLMRVDGRRPQRVSTAVGDVLFWARLPAPAPTP